MAGDRLDLRGRKTRAAKRRRPSARGARKTGHVGSAARLVDGGLRPRLPRPPAPDSPGQGGAGPAGPAAPVVTWSHLLRDGSDAEFRVTLRALAAVVRRLDVIHDLAGRAIGLSGTRLEFLLTVAEYGAPRAPRPGEVGKRVGIRQVDLADILGISPYYASAMARELAGRGLIARRPDPAHPGRRVLVPTDEGRRTAARAARLVTGAHNAAFAPLDADGFAALRRIARALDKSSESAVEILARRAGEPSWRSLRELARLAERTGVDRSGSLALAGDDDGDADEPEEA